MLRYTAANMGPHYREHTCFLQPQDSFASYDVATCLTPVADRINVLLVGDSTAAHLVPALRTYLDPQRYNLLQLNSAGCTPFIGFTSATSRNCDQINATFATVLREHRVSAVILSGHWSVYLKNLEPAAMERAATAGSDSPFDVRLNATLAATSKAGMPVLLLGPSLEFPAPLAPTLVRLEQTHVPVGNHLRVLPWAYRADARVRRLSADFDNIQFVSVLDALCRNGDCPLKIDAETTIVWDSLHLTPEGATYVINRLRPELDSFLRKLRQESEHAQPGPAAAGSRVEATAGSPPEGD
jgi:hypothetical protein